jgi:antirestriction protein ArdC
MTTKPNKTTVADVIADRFITSLQNGVAPWQKPWVSLAPQNGVSRRIYSGVNIFTLGWFGSDDYYLTFKQVQALGGKVEQGTKGLPVVFWSRVEDRKAKAQGEKKDFLLARYYTVFPVNKCNLPDFKRANKVIEFTPIEAAERLVQGFAELCPIEHGGKAACYSPYLHRINMPLRESFKSVEEYYSTLFHEIGHSLMPDRKVGIGETYAKEELVAELFASLCMNETGLLKTAVYNNSAAYLNGWLDALNNDKSLIQKAAREAHARYLKFTGKSLNEEQEQEQEA